MKTKTKRALRASSALLLVFGMMAADPARSVAAGLTLETAPPVVVETFPKAGSLDVDPNLSEIRVRFSKPMADGSWSWVEQDKETFPSEIGTPRYSADKRTCTLPVKLQIGKVYNVWINHPDYKNFTDAAGRAAVPYLLSFATAEKAIQTGGYGSATGTVGAGGGGGGGGAPGWGGTEATVPAAAPSAMFLPGLNENQKLVLEWTDRQFRSFFDARSFEAWDPAEYAALEDRLIETLKGPHSRDYFLAINTLGAMRSAKALPALRAIAYERADRNNRDRWMSIRSLGLIQKPEDVPNLIHLVYHGNVNTHWWAQIALVKMTGQNFGPDWNAWADWWKRAGSEPAFNPEIIRWWAGQPEPEALAKTLAASDEQFLQNLKPKEGTGQP